MLGWAGRLAVALVAAGLVGGTARAATPLDSGNWFLFAHMSNSGGMFDGNGDLQPTYSFGTFVASPTASTADFERPFDSVLAPGAKILFITGDLTVWGQTDYATLRALIDAHDGTLNSANIAFDTNAGTVNGNVLSRTAFVEDPWIGIANGNHFDAINQGLIVWGDSNYNAVHTALKNNHGGLNVYIQDGAQDLPEPAGMAVLGMGLLGLARARRRA